MPICHTPVLLPLLLSQLPAGSRWVLDATLGEGGHTAAFLKRGLRVVAFERDAAILKKAVHWLAPHCNFSEVEGVAVANNFFPLQDNFSKATELAKTLNKAPAVLPFYFPLQKTLFEEQSPKISGFDFILMDLGISKYHYLEGGRGFSFQKDEPLDMRLEATQGQSAARVVNTYSERKLAHLFFTYGEEPYANWYARRLCAARLSHPITTSGQLATVIAAAYYKKKRYSRLHPATRVFQALRIYVNEELRHLEIGLRAMLPLLASSGRLAVLAYHSLEDRCVKNLFNEVADRSENYNKYRQSAKRSALSVLSRKVFKADAAEVKQNPAARSARLRVLVKA